MPNIKQLAKAQRRSVSQCGHGCMVGYNKTTDEHYLVPLRCKSWCCEQCRVHKGLSLIARIVAGAPDRFITLTCNPARYPSKHHALLDMKASLPILVRAIRKKYGDFEAAYVWELTKRGWPHVHLAARSAYIDQRWLSEYWKNLTGASIVHICKVRSHEHAAKYMSKYLLKDMFRTVQLLGRRPVVQFTRHYIPEDYNENTSSIDGGVEWHFDPRSFDEIASAWRDRDLLPVPNDTNPDLPTFLQFETFQSTAPPVPNWNQSNLNFRYEQERFDTVDFSVGEDASSAEAASG